MTTKRQLGATAVMTGSALGAVAGTLQATIGSSIPTWTGAKASPLALGVLTVVVSFLAGAGALLSADTTARQDRSWSRRSRLR